ncbi:MULTISPECIES: glycosyltransferase family 2 protein [unclassified Rhizobium]|uniref:glycosyltransferase family 2 protein n=1 Tax=Agrobacterium cavarae TaxID=2528239 RepID=UPI000A6DEDBE
MDYYISQCDKVRISKMNAYLMGQQMCLKHQLHVVIVNYRTSALTIRCVRSILRHGIVSPSRITIVENCSGDASFEELSAALPEVSIIQSPSNGGFGAGVNFGCRGLSEKYFLILNPDTYFEYDSVSTVIAHMEENKDVGIVGLDLINPDGTRQYSARRFYSALDIFARRSKALSPFMPKRIERHLMQDAYARNIPFDAEWVMGTGFIIQRDVLDAVGGMDVDYFLYMEDVDLCARVWCEGYRVQCLPQAQLVHDHQRSSAASPLSFAGKTHLKSLLKFARRFSLPLIRPPGTQNIIASFSGRR